MQKNKLQPRYIRKMFMLPSCEEPPEITNGIIGKDNESKLVKELKSSVILLFAIV